MSNHIETGDGRCTATNRNGVRCRYPKVRGTQPGICRFHGGSAPHVKEAANRRLLAGADLAIDYLLNLLLPRPPCEHCGRSDADRDPVVVRACQLVLDRSGFGPQAKIEVARVDHSELQSLTDEQLAERMEQLAARARGRTIDAKVIQDSGVQIPGAIEIPEDSK